MPSYQPVLAACVGTPSLVAGAILIVKSRQMAVAPGSERARDFFVVGVSMLVLSGFIFSTAAYTWYEDRVSQGTLHFRYHVVLESNGTGLLRVSLPVPVPEDLIAGLVVSPPSSFTAINRSGPEPALDVVFSTRTTVDASFDGYRPGTPLNLTYSPEFYECYPGDCTSELSLTVLQGSITDVRVQLTVLWTYPCSWPSWEVDSTALPGRRTYPAETGWMVC